MAKKFFDIIPPKKRLIKSFEDKPGFEEKKIIRKDNPPKIKNRTRRPKRVFLKIIFFCLLFLLLVALPGIFIFSDTEIEIWPETRTLVLNDTISVNLDQEEVDLEIKSIPGELLRDQKSASQDFSATGKTTAEQEAKGIIRVYNSYSSDSQPLLINTRFVSADGKLFKSVKREVIAGGTYEKGKLIPGETDIEVIAAKIGEDYNIEPSTFSIPGFSGTAKYTTFYGRSFSPMRGGFEGESFQVTQNNLDDAKNVLSSSLREESRKFLKKSFPEGFILLDEAIFQEIIKEEYSAEAEEILGSFNLNMEVKSVAFIFKNSDIENFVKNLINLNISEGETFQEESLEISYMPKLLAKEEEGNIDVEGGKMILDLEIRVKVYSDINLDELKKAISGRSLQEVEAFLSDQSGLVKKKVKLGPFWRRKLPQELDKIEIKLNLE